MNIINLSQKNCDENHESIQHEEISQKQDESIKYFNQITALMNAYKKDNSKAIVEDLISINTVLSSNKKKSPETTHAHFKKSAKKKNTKKH